MIKETLFGTSRETLLGWAKACRVLAVAAAFGTVFTTFPPFGFFKPSWMSPQGLSTWTLFLHVLLTVPFMLFVPVMAWAVAQYLDYLSGKTQAVGWFSRNLHIMLLLLAAGSAVGALLQLTLTPLYLAQQNRATSAALPIAANTILPALKNIGGALFHFGLADLVRRSRHLVEEWRLTI